MYIYNDFLKLKTSELSDYSARGFALCYVETNDHLDIKDEHDLCDFIGDCRGHCMFKCDDK